MKITVTEKEKERVAHMMGGMRRMGGMSPSSSPTTSSPGPPVHPGFQRDARVLTEILLPDRKLDIPIGVSPPVPAYQFLSDREYKKKYFVDLRWHHLEWQKYSFSRDKYLINKRRFIVQKAPRRHGKTWALCHCQVQGLVFIQAFTDNPVGAYYCPDKGQALKNAWKAFAHATRNIPHVKLNERNGIITWPSPTLENPQSKVTIYIMGVRGGSGVKRGSYYDWCTLDEVEFLSNAFIQEVGMGSTFDRQGTVALTGTPYNLGVLDEWLYKAQEAMRVQDDVAKGILAPDSPGVPADYDDWFAFTGDCWNLGVYPRKYLLKLKASMDTATFEQEMECKNPSDIKVFYFRDNYEIAVNENRISPHIRPDPRLPVRFYYDFGIGRKSDRCAWSAWQFTTGYPVCLFSGEVIGKSYSGIVRDILDKTPWAQAAYEHLLPHDTGAREQSDLVDKKTKFQTELREQGVGGHERTNVLKRHKNPELVNGIVNDVMHVVRINSLHAKTLVQALQHHRRKYDKNTRLVEEVESKTKYRDSAHMFRYAIMDWKNGDYMNRQPTRTEMLVAHGDDGRGILPVEKGGHPVGNSIIIDKDNNGHLRPISLFERGVDGGSEGLGDERPSRAINVGAFFR